MAITYLNLPKNLFGIVSFQVHGVIQYTENGQTFCEWVDESEQTPQFYSVYSRSQSTDNNPLNCVADCTDEQSAIELAAHLTMILYNMVPFPDPEIKG